LATPETRKLVPAGAQSRGSIPVFAGTLDALRAHAHAEHRHWERAENRLKTAENRRIEGWPKTAAPTWPESRRLRRNGRFGRKCDDRPKRKRGDSRGVKIEIAPLYADMQVSL
jgi:hypothetical protein